MLNELANEIHHNAVQKGWWRDNRQPPEIIALCHSELSEALEEYRSGHMTVYIHNGKPEGLPVEMIDAMIRILDYLAHLGVDVDELMRLKMDYNQTRPERHGGKVC